jgi:ACS family pantothenate transporter-like MFS transporter
MFSYINVIWYTIAVWRTADAPRFHAGFTACAVFGAAMISLTVILQFLQRRDNRKRAADGMTVDDIEATEAALPRASLAEAATETVKDGVTPQK